MASNRSGSANRNQYNALIDSTASESEALSAEEDANYNGDSMKTDNSGERTKDSDRHRNVYRSTSAPAKANPTQIVGPRTTSQRTVSESHAPELAPVSSGKGTRKRVAMSKESQYERRKQINRKAAQKSRNREKEKETRLIKESLDEECKRTRLKYQIKQLTAVLQHYERVLKEHKENQNQNSVSRCVLETISKSTDVIVTQPGVMSHSVTPSAACGSASGRSVRSDSPSSAPSTATPEVPFARYLLPSNGNPQCTNATPRMLPDASGNSANAQQENLGQSTATENSSTAEDIGANSTQPHTFIPMDRFRQLACQMVKRAGNESGNGAGENNTNNMFITSLPASGSVNNMSGMNDATSVTTTIRTSASNAVTGTNCDFNAEQQQPNILTGFVAPMADGNQYQIVATELTHGDITRQGLSAYVVTSTASPGNNESNAQFGMQPTSDAQNASRSPEVQVSNGHDHSIAVSALLELNRGIFEDD